MSQTPIDALVTLRGIETQFIDAYGKPTSVAAGTKEKILGVMGYDIENEGHLVQQINEQVSDAWMTPLDPVKVLRHSSDKLIALRLPITMVNTPLLLKVKTETGTELLQNVTANEHTLVNAADIEDSEYQEFAVELECDLPDGYHTIRLMHDTQVLAEGRLIMAPDACYTPEKIAQGHKVWGLSVQLYCARSERNWGIGDFTDLQALLRNAAQQGADFIGLNPIHALYPNEPDSCSPYSPSSRKWLNHLYIDVTAVPEYCASAIQKMVSEGDFATCMFGSRDIFHKGVRASYTSVNGVTFHDGFTLQDVVSYKDKHNEANLEGNRDGHNHNASCNYGIEGPTDDVVINHVRERQKRNLFASMIFAQGTPLVLNGDELSRTQLGNNNAYCQDNELNYCDWDFNRQQADFLAFCQYCIALKQSGQILTNAQLADDAFFEQCNVDAVHWYKIDGSPKADSDWHDPTNKGFAVELVGSFDNQEHWLICVNADKVDYNMVLPKAKQNHRWQVVLDTRMTDFKPTGAYIAKPQFVISNRSFVIFKQDDPKREA